MGLEWLTTVAYTHLATHLILRSNSSVTMSITNFVISAKLSMMPCERSAKKPYQEIKKPYRFNEKQKTYLEAKFDIGECTGRKMEPDVVAKEMRRARGTDGERLFCASEFLTPQQVSSYFSRLAAKRRQQQAQEVTPQDVLAAEEQINFSLARAEVISNLQVRHPIVVD